MNEKTKKILAGIFALVLVAVCGVWFLMDGMEHIEDTNGPDDFSLAVITDGNIINYDIGSLNVKKSSGILNDGITFSSDRFSGVYEILVTNFIGKSDFYMDLTGFYVTEGNFRMVVVNNDEIVAEVQPGMFAECHLDDLTGSLRLGIAGESAAFEFTMDRLFCEQYGVEIG